MFEGGFFCLYGCLILCAFERYYISVCTVTHVYIYMYTHTHIFTVWCWEEVRQKKRE